MINMLHLNWAVMLQRLKTCGQMGFAGQSALVSSQDDDPQADEWCFGQPRFLDDQPPTGKRKKPKAKKPKAPIPKAKQRQQRNKAKTKASRKGDSKAKKAQPKASRARKAVTENETNINSNAFETKPDDDQKSIESSLGHAQCMTPQQRHAEQASASHPASSPPKRSKRLKKLQDENEAFNTTPDANQKSMEQVLGDESGPTARHRYSQAKAKSRSAATPKSSRTTPKAKPQRKARAKAKAKTKAEGKRTSKPRSKVKAPSSRPKTDRGNGNSKSDNSSSSSDSSIDSYSMGSDRTLNSESPSDHPVGEPDPQTARAFLEPSEMFGELLEEDTSCPAESVSPRAKNLQPDQVNSRQDAFSFVDRHLRRLQSHFGNQCLINLSDNLGKMAVMSLYSGLGGAEISAGLIYHSMTRLKADDPNSFPDTFARKAPSMHLACDFNSDCQKVLRSHIDPWPKQIAGVGWLVMADLNTRKSVVKFIQNHSTFDFSFDIDDWTLSV